MHEFLFVRQGIKQVLFSRMNPTVTCLSYQQGCLHGIHDCCTWWLSQLEDCKHFPTRHEWWGDRWCSWSGEDLFPSNHQNQLFRMFTGWRIPSYSLWLECAYMWLCGILAYFRVRAVGMWSKYWHSQSGQTSNRLVVIPGSLKAPDAGWITRKKTARIFKLIP